MQTPTSGPGNTELRGDPQSDSALPGTNRSVAKTHSFFSCFVFYWKIFALQNFVFCQTSTWISHRYTYISSLLNLPRISLSIPFLQVDTEPLFEFPEPYSKFLLAIYITHGKVSFHVTLSILLTLSCPLTMSISLFSMSASPLLPCK